MGGVVPFNAEKLARLMEEAGISLLLANTEWQPRRAAQARAFGFGSRR